MGPLAAIGIGLGGAALSGLGGFLGGSDKVDVPAFPRVDFDRIESEGMETMLAQMPAASATAAAASKANAAQIAAMFDIAVPGSSALAGENILSLMKGELPKAVEESLLRSSAASALSRGFAGTGFQATATMLGMRGKALEAMQLGQGMLMQYATPYLAATVSPTSMFFTPQQRAQQAMWQAEQSYQRNLQAAQAAAMPSKLEQGLGAGLGALGGMAMSVGAYGIGQSLFGGAAGGMSAGAAFAGGLGAGLGGGMGSMMAGATSRPPGAATSFTPTASGAAWSTTPAWPTGTSAGTIAGSWQ